MPRIIQLPLSGRDRRHFVRELRAAQAAHRDMPDQVAEAYRVAHALACEEWNVRQFIGGPAEPSPSIADAIAASRELLEVRCRRCAHASLVDLTELVWPRKNPVHTLARVLRCAACRDGRGKPAPDLVALRERNPPKDAPPARRAAR
jgi:hypothetical protein